ncbi:hypothetical protein [Pseudomonas vancouverensis]|uniref:Uncharacterized protein n=1 Tax=Pseudomonas vancouverensis TaxID=95300 RepID=A0A1H2N8W8_PSEVA|nr:hypothetical protein [Pseudomonas vancouverensis]KAB0494001.1 hypothetical protein F7R09_19675 [Pseudomonas vancouverensis]TDB63519.1 hypothetical protein EIY72_13025 [Pseudomonas vancouverensis]SDV01545.1 hypothetical protein SAMN05216558_1846 [Pseudomonas vancouverensis]
MDIQRLAAPTPSNYRYAVFCCSFKWELGSTPDHAMALFADEAMAKRYGALMWPSTFEVVDRFALAEMKD